MNTIWIERIQLLAVFVGWAAFLWMCGAICQYKAEERAENGHSERIGE